MGFLFLNNHTNNYISDYIRHVVGFLNSFLKFMIYSWIIIPLDSWVRVVHGELYP